VPWIGLYTHGEIAPIGNQQVFHNYTLVLTAIY
jgi:small ligand-binding sensory domain FIST